jgi:hypothetical protein
MSLDWQKIIFNNKNNFMVTLLYHVVKLRDKKDMTLRITKRKWLILFGEKIVFANYNVTSN